MWAFLRKTKKYECLLRIFLSAQEGIHEEDCTINHQYVFLDFIKKCLTIKNWNQII